jgi:hypothetical protein
MLGRPRRCWPGPTAILARCAGAARALCAVIAPGAHACWWRDAAAADWRQGFPDELEGTFRVAPGKFMRAGAHRGGRVTRGEQRRWRAAAFLRRWSPPAAGDGGGGVLQHRGREEEMRRMANRIHGARRSGSLRRGGFGGGNFNSGAVVTPRRP